MANITDEEAMAELLADKRRELEQKAREENRRREEHARWQSLREAEEKFDQRIEKASLLDLWAAIRHGIENGQCWQDSLFKTAFRELERRAKIEDRSTLESLNARFGVEVVRYL